MNDLPDNELLSAYLDDELTAAERQQVEALLAASPAARQLLDELRALSNTLHALPRESLGEDLSPRVLRLAERRMLTGSPPVAAGGDGAPMPLGRSLLHRFTRPRILVWLAITAMIVVMIRINEDRENQRVARAPQEVARAPAEPRAALPPSSMEAYPKATAADKYAPAGPASVVTSPEPTGGEPSAAKRGLGESIAAARAPAKPAADKPSPPSLAAPPAGTPAGAKSSGGPQPAQPMVEMSKAAAAGKSAVDAEAGERKDRKGGEITREPMNRKLAKSGAQEKSRQKQKSPAPQPPAEAVMVVNCDVSPEAARKQTFDRLLVSNGIVWQQAGVAGPGGVPLLSSASKAAASSPPASAPPAAQRAQSSSERLSGETSGKKPMAGAALAEQREEKPSVEEKAQRQTAVAVQAGQPPPGEEKLEVVYVEASTAQIDATLKDLAGRPDAFPSLVVEPAPGETSQRAFFQYNRAAGLRQAGAAGMGQAFQAGQPAAASAKSAEGGAQSQSSRVRRAREGQADHDRLPIVSQAEREAAPLPSQWAIRNVLQAAPQNRTSSPAFAQRVQLDAAGRLLNQQAADYGTPANAANSAMQPPPPAKALAADASRQVQQKPGQRDALDQRAESNAPTQRVFFVLRVQGSAAAVARPPENPGNAAAPPAKPPADRGRSAPEPAKPAAASPPQK